jgi:hypothetical protein
MGGFRGGESMHELSFSQLARPSPRLTGRSHLRRRAL